MAEQGGEGAWGTRTIREYERVEQIGEGTYGKVYKARARGSGRMVAIKQVKLPSEFRRPRGAPEADEQTRRKHDREGIPKTAVREIRVLTDPVLQTRNMVELLEVVTATVDDARPSDMEERGETSGATSVTDRAGTVYFVFDYVAYDLSGLILSKLDFSGRAVKALLSQLLASLDTLHQHRFVHRDIKSSNVLVTDHYEVKLADFGFARKARPPMTPGVVTLWYRAPELLLGETSYTSKVDLWSAGCIFVELCAKRPLVEVGDEESAICEIVRLQGLPAPGSYLTTLPGWRAAAAVLDAHGLGPSSAGGGGGGGMVRSLSAREGRLDALLRKLELTPAAIDLAKGLLSLDPNARLSAADALQHPYFREEPKVLRSNPTADLPPISESIDVSADHHEFSARNRRRAEREKAHTLDPSGAPTDRSTLADMKRAAAAALGPIVGTTGTTGTGALAAAIAIAAAAPPTSSTATGPAGVPSAPPRPHAGGGFGSAAPTSTATSSSRRSAPSSDAARAAARVDDDPDQLEPLVPLGPPPVPAAIASLLAVAQARGQHVPAQPEPTQQPAHYSHHPQQHHQHHHDRSHDQRPPHVAAPHPAAPHPAAPLPETREHDDRRRAPEPRGSAERQAAAMVGDIYGGGGAGGGGGLPPAPAPGKWLESTKARSRLRETELAHPPDKRARHDTQ